MKNRWLEGPHLFYPTRLPVWPADKSQHQLAVIAHLSRERERFRLVSTVEALYSPSHLITFVLQDCVTVCVCVNGAHPNESFCRPTDRTVPTNTHPDGYHDMYSVLHTHTQRDVQITNTFNDVQIRMCASSRSASQCLSSFCVTSWTSDPVTFVFHLSCVMCMFLL